MPVCAHKYLACFVNSYCQVRAHSSEHALPCLHRHNFLLLLCVHRPTALNKYFLEYNGRLGRLSSDFAVSQLCKGKDLTDPQQAEYSPTASSRGSLDSNASERTDTSNSSGSTISVSQCSSSIVRVLVGHSLGGICAAMEALRVPGEVSKSMSLKEIAPGKRLWNQ